MDTEGESIPLSGRDHSTPLPADMEMEVDPTLMDNLWAKELTELDGRDRELTDENLHAIRSLAVPETTERISHALNQMQKEINEIPEKEKQSHLRGLELGSMYIQSLAFRLKFLRSVQLDAKVAATRYCNCLDLLSDVFGESALMRRLYVTDLGDEEIDFMKEGQFQVLPSRDRLGRRIVVYNIRPLKRSYSVDTMFRVYVYILHAIVSEDISTQKHGMVYIGILQTDEELVKSHQQKGSSTSDIHRVHKMYAGTPLYWGAVHLCVPDEPVYRIITAFFLAFLGQGGRKLMRIHRGNRIECNYRLRSFGIPVGDMPQMHSGHIKTTNHLRLMNMRMAMDKSQTEQEKRFKNRRKSKKTAPEAIKPFSGIECPEVDFMIISHPKNDEGLQNNHPGNTNFRKMMVLNEGFKRFLADRDNSEFNRQSKVTQIVDDVLFDACGEGLQFAIYEKEKGYYTEVVNQEDLRQNIEKILRRYRSQFWAQQSTAKNLKATGRPFDLSHQNNKDDCCGGCLS
jgi:hypothetical protein